MTKLGNTINKNFDQHFEILKKISTKSFTNKIFLASKIISDSLLKNRTIFWCGNGGSATDSMHLSAELIGRFKKNRRPLKSISLAGNPASITCISNDFGYSKHPDETFRIWEKDKVFEDVIYAIRNFKPDVIINRFDHRTPGKTHGHHTGSAMLAFEAFDKAADPNV